MKPYVYLAGPYTKGDPAINARSQLRLADELLTDGLVLPHAPLVSHFQHTMFPQPYLVWLTYDLEILPRFDALLRQPATNERDSSYLITESSGADREEAVMRQLGKPVFYTKADLYAWVKKESKS